MSAHTPGPWRWMNDDVLVADHGSRRVILTPEGGRNAELATCGDDGLLRTFKCDEPNARLIAAAPKLLDALKDAILTLEAIKENWGDEHSGLYKTIVEELVRLRPVVAKVEAA